MIEIPDTFELLPAAAEDFEPDAELAAISDPDAIEPVVEERIPFGMTWLLDTDTGLLNTYGGVPVVVTGTDTVKVWASVVLSTKRLAHPIFSDDIGMDDPDHLIGHAYDAERNADYIRDVRAALLVHDRITDVRDFKFRYDPDEEFVEMDATIILDDDEDIELEGLRLAYGPA